MEMRIQDAILLILIIVAIFSKVDAQSPAEWSLTDRGIDVNEDGLYDFLTIDAGVDVWVPGEYSLMAYLYDPNNKEVIWAIDHEILLDGYHAMRLDFDGKSIKNHGVNGPYHLENVTLFSGSSYTGLNICDYLRRAYVTSAYNCSDFGAGSNSGNETLGSIKYELGGKRGYEGFGVKTTFNNSDITDPT